MITLYGVAGPNVAKTRASLLRKGLPFEQVEVDLIRQSDEFRRLTPIGKVPLIQDDGLVVHDSLFIAEYLDRKYPDAPMLLPRPLPQRVKAYTIFALLDRMFTVASPLVAKRLGFLDLVDATSAACSGYYAVDETLHVALESRLSDSIYLLSAMLGGDCYFTGATATQADFAVFAWMTFFDQLRLPVHPLRDWMAERTPEFPFDAMFETNAVVTRRAI